MRSKKKDLDLDLPEQLEAQTLVHIIQNLDYVMEKVGMSPDNWTSSFSCDDCHCDVS